METAKAVLAFADRLSETRGDPNTVIYLKESLRLLQKAIAGQPERKAAGPLRIGIDRHGFPKVLPLEIRRLAHKGETLALQVCVFVLGLYREVIIPGTLKLHTITDGCTYDLDIYRSWCAWDRGLDEFVDCLKSFGFKPFSPKDLKWEGPHVTNKSGPNGRAMLTSFIDAAHLMAHPLWTKFQNFASLMDTSRLDADPFAPGLVELIRRLGKYAWRWQLSSIRETPPKVGRLSTKEEAAGKIRVFAIPDYWTQSVLKVLHQRLFEVLKLLPTDCTFDQAAGVRRAQQAALDGVLHFWSFDLSAATDRFPVTLQVDVLRALMSGEHAEPFAALWRELLVGREYVYSPFGEEPQKLTYGVGQPMGAYSSWAAFALAHHALVQRAARRAGATGWYYNYQLLGDDIVFWGDDVLSERVAMEYLSLIRYLGVEINLSKSLVSENGTFEFAKNLVKGGMPLTPFHLKEWKMGLKTPENFSALIRLLRERKIDIPPLRAILTWFHIRGLVIRGAKGLSKPFGSWPRHVVQLVVLLFSPVGAYPTPCKPWSLILQENLKSLGDMDVRWPEPLRAEPEEGKVILFDEDIELIRGALWERWELAARALASKCLINGVREKETIRDINELLVKRGCSPDVLDIQRMLSIHPWSTESARIYRILWRETTPFLYGEIAAGGMQDSSWWAGEDLPDQAGPNEILRSIEERKNRPLEEFISSPSPEVLGLSMPSTLSELEQREKFKSSMVLKAHKAVGEAFVERQRLSQEPSRTTYEYGFPASNMPGGDPRKRTYHADLDPSTTVPARVTAPKPQPMTTRESFIEAAFQGLHALLSAFWGCKAVGFASHRTEPIRAPAAKIAPRRYILLKYRGSKP
jgi:hypothetical protein